jgi:hypothetical protein
MVRKSAAVIGMNEHVAVMQRQGLHSHFKLSPTETWSATILAGENVRTFAHMPHMIRVYKTPHL